MKAPTIHRAWLRPDLWRRFRTGVSLHSHTCHSRERIGPLEWRPPIAPREAWQLERAQIETALQRPALISITDHDNIDAPLRLRVLSDSRNVPVSLEWTVPFHETEFHLGLHNLPPRRAHERMAALERHTKDPRWADLEGLLDWTVQDPETLVVFNHPCWDERRVGPELHMRRAGEFIRRYRPHLHALELNGLRPWAENRRTVELSLRCGLPVVSGGDRHALEPNALLNLTCAATFSEFVEEVRAYGRSEALIMPQYRKPLALRVARMVAEVIHQRPRHTSGIIDINVEPLSSDPIHPSRRLFSNH